MFLKKKSQNLFKKPVFKTFLSQKPIKEVIAEIKAKKEAEKSAKGEEAPKKPQTIKKPTKPEGEEVSE